MNEHQAFYENRFVRNLARYSSLRERIQQKVKQILDDRSPSRHVPGEGAS